MREEEKTFFNCEDRIDRIFEVQLFLLFLLLFPPVSWIGFLFLTSSESEEKKGTIVDFLLGLLVMIVVYILTVLTDAILCLKPLVDCSTNLKSTSLFVITFAIITGIVDIFLYLVCESCSKLKVWIKKNPFIFP